MLGEWEGEGGSSDFYHQGSRSAPTAAYYCTRQNVGPRVRRVRPVHTLMMVGVQFMMASVQFRVMI